MDDYIIQSFYYESSIKKFRNETGCYGLFAVSQCYSAHGFVVFKKLQTYFLIHFDSDIG